MKNKIKIGYIGLGRRGYAMLNQCFSEMSDVEITTLCDWDEKKSQKAADMLKEKGKPAPKITTDHMDIMNDPEIDAIIIMSGWNTHVELAKAGMLAGKYVGVEVGCAYDLQQCFDLIETYEQTKSPLMMLENCCYGRDEMMVLNMVKKGLFGEIVHCKGGYLHHLPAADLFLDGEYDHYRIQEYIHRNCENYPTHELGPISKCLSLNRGNRMMKLTSVASKSKALKEYVAKNLPADSEFQTVEYKQGDIVNTVITCANGETILLTLDTTLPRPYYSRDFTVRGTRGCYAEDRYALFIEEGRRHDWSDMNNREESYEKYDHPLTKEYFSGELKGGHGGMDWLVCRAFVESVKNGTNTPIDAYDTVSWMAIAPLSEMSIQLGGAPVDVPDFTKGKWIRREPPVTGKYSLDVVVEDPDTPIFPE